MVPTLIRDQHGSLSPSSQEKKFFQPCARRSEVFLKNYYPTHPPHFTHHTPHSAPHVGPCPPWGGNRIAFPILVGLDILRHDRRDVFRGPRRYYPPSSLDAVDPSLAVSPFRIVVVFAATRGDDDYDDGDYDDYGG